MSETIDNLKRGKDLAWMTLAPAFQHAMMLAKEAEYAARVTSDAAMTNIAPNYPPIVALLADAGQAPSGSALIEWRDRLTVYLPTEEGDE